MKRFLKRLTAGTVIIGFVVAGTTACASQVVLMQQLDRNQDKGVQQLADDARALGADQIVEILDDGDITRVELDEAARGFQDCYLAQGLTLDDPVLSPVDNVTLEWPFPEIPQDSNSEAVTKCSQQWSIAAAAYSATHESFMEPGLSAYVAECLVDQGYEINSEASKVLDFVGDPLKDNGAQRAAAEQCIYDGALKLFPDLPGVTVQY